MVRFQASGPQPSYTPVEGPKAGDQLIGLYNMWQSISPETRDWLAGLFKSAASDEENPGLATEQDIMNNEMFQAEQATAPALQRGFDKDFNGEDAFNNAIEAALHASDDYKKSQQSAFDASQAAKQKADQRAAVRTKIAWPVSTFHENLRGWGF